MIVNNKAKSITISSSNSGQRLDNFLISQIKNVPKSHVYKLIRTGQVRINSSRSKPSTKLNIDDVVRIPPYKANENIKPKISKELINKTISNIIYEDEYIMVFNKPSAVAVHSGTNIGYGLIDIIRLVKTECERIDLLHRLDKDTSGCIIITKKLSSLRFFQTQLKDNILQKKYICLVDGLWDNALKRDEINLLRNSKSSKSITEFKVLKKYKNSTLLEVKIVTGRYHQIRKHCSLLGHAIIGDIRYGNKDINRLYKKNGLSRIFLHSSSISFIERKSEKLNKIECSLPIELMKYLENHK
ncbi:MAG: RluA family pseudouridine synthase [Gammaproteobacteria bacterium]|nr:RluA family pseudouridine synthase [Gammaproteobacteria bacterium]